MCTPRIVGRRFFAIFCVRNWARHSVNFERTPSHVRPKWNFPGITPILFWARASQHLTAGISHRTIPLRFQSCVPQYVNFPLCRDWNLDNVQKSNHPPIEAGSDFRAPHFRSVCNSVMGRRSSFWIREIAFFLYRKTYAYRDPPYQIGPIYPAEWISV